MRHTHFCRLSDRLQDANNYDVGDKKIREQIEAQKKIEQKEKAVAQSRKNSQAPLPAVNDHNRKNIFSQPIQLDKDFKPPVFEKSRLQKAFLMDALQDSFLFLDKTTEEKDIFINAMQTETYAAGSTIIQQGDMGDYFYIVSQGTVGFVKDGEDAGSCTRGAAFDELALLYDAPRAATCVAKTEVQVYKVDQKTFRLILASQQTEQDKDYRELLRGINIFKDLDEATLSRFVRALTPVKWKEGDRIVQKGEEGNVFYIVQSGKVLIHDIGLGDSKFEDQVLHAGDWFGERALITGEPRAANATAVSDSLLLAMDRKTFEKTVGSLKSLMELEMRKNFLKSLPLFSKGESPLEDPELNQLVGLMEEVAYPKHYKLATAGAKYEMKLWIIRHGRLLVIQKSSGKIYNLDSGDHFGDKSICSPVERISSHDAVVEEDMTAWVLTKESIESVVGDIKQLGVPRRPSHKPPSRKILFSELQKHKVLGQGAFGKVWLVEHTPTHKSFALKTVGKLDIIESRQEDSILREKELLELLSHPFILNLMGTFQDEDNLYFLLPLIPGGELFSVLHRQKTKGRGLANFNAAFYSACVIEALGHFHQRSVAYRDLKLENIMIDEDGFCVIVDLGFAKVVEDKTFTLVGTPEYLAPELIMSKGHDKAVDYWSFGVLCYELLCGVSPFYIPKSKQIDMFKRIVMGKYSIPTYVAAEAADMISKLLVRRDIQRLGNLSRGYVDIKNHPWYEASGINFKDVIDKKSEVPWKPVLKDPLDASNFDDFSSYEKDEPKARKLTEAEQEKFIFFSV